MKVTLDAFDVGTLVGDYCRRHPETIADFGALTRVADQAKLLVRLLAQEARAQMLRRVVIAHACRLQAESHNRKVH